MKKQPFLLLMHTLTLLVATVAIINPVQAQPDLNAYSGTAVADSQIDGVIGDEWSDAGSYADVAKNPQGTAQIHVKKTAKTCTSP